MFLAKLLFGRLCGGGRLTLEIIGLIFYESVLIDQSICRPLLHLLQNICIFSE